MKLFIILVIAFTLFCAADAWLYGKAPWPERMNSFLYKLPGGGFVAYYTLRKSSPPVDERR